MLTSSFFLYKSTSGVTKVPTCPYCGKYFKTKRGLKQHIYRSHPYAIETIEKDARKFQESVRKSARKLLGKNRRRRRKR